MHKYINIIENNKIKTKHAIIDKIGKSIMNNKITHEVFTDGSCKNNNRKSTKSIAGYGVFWGDNDQRNLAKPFKLKPLTNNRAELYAIYMAIKTLSLTPLMKKTTNTLIIYSDSKYCIDTLTSYIKSWKKRGWKKSNGKTPLNLDLICKIDDLSIENIGIFSIKYIHVRAHKSAPKNKRSIEYYKWYGNNQADKFAVNGCNKSYK